MGKMITVSSSDDISKVQQRLQKRAQGRWILPILERYGDQGVTALSQATPIESGETASSWYYTIGSKNGNYYIDFHNRHIVEGVPIAIILQYGHGTGTGGYVAGRDYINPAIRPIFDQILTDVRREVNAT